MRTGGGEGGEEGEQKRERGKGGEEREGKRGVERGEVGGGALFQRMNSSLVKCLN